jgi:hypothetical protein
VTATFNKFRNVIVCEDIRDEVGNKRSLMGVMAGDILVAGFPATLQIAIFLDYAPDADDGDHLSIEFRLVQGDVEIAKGGMEAAILPGLPANFILPRALVTFEKESTFRMFVSINQRPEQEILSKKIGQASVTS